MSRCVRCVISGRVQGVWFRASTQREAQARGLTGWVSNRPDGAVEVLACGPEEGLVDLKVWLWQGPPSSQVAEVRCHDEPPGEYTGFDVRY